MESGSSPCPIVRYLQDEVMLNCQSTFVNFSKSEPFLDSVKN